MTATEEGDDYLQLAAKLYADSKPFLAIKAYERALAQLEGSEEEEEDTLTTSTSGTVPLSLHGSVGWNTLFKDFILHCNAFCVKSATVDIKVARDFLRLCLTELQRRNYIQGNLDADNLHQLFIPVQEDRGIAFLVSLTLNNWACLLLRSGNTVRATAVLQVALANAVAEEIIRIILLNICAVNVHNCSFQETQERAMEVLFEDEEGYEDEDERICGDSTTREDVDGLLHAFAHHYLAIADEYLQPYEAENHYNQAREMLVSSPYQQWSSIIECTRKRFVDIIQRRKEEAARRREIAESEMEAARQVEAAIRRKGGRPKTGLTRHSSLKPVNRGKKGKRRNSGTNNLGKEESLDLPPISDYLKEKMQEEGLTNVAVPVLRVVEVERMVLGGEQAMDESIFPFAVGATSNNVAIILMCEETPLQVVDEVELKELPPPRRTIWSPIPKKNDDIVLSPEPKVTHSTRHSPDFSTVLKTFMPPPISERSIENAQRSVAAFRKILNHRLLTLLQAERVYEERWQATNVVRNALSVFKLAQDIVKLKASMKMKREARVILENASARRIVRFFRLIIERNSSDGVPILREARVRYFEEKAAICLQRYARRWLAIKELRRIQEEHRAEVRRITKLQSMFHMNTTRRWYLAQMEERKKALALEKESMAREFAATQIQRAYRRHMHQLHKWYEERDLKQFILHHFKSSRGYYATVIQKVFRGYLVRRVYGPAIYAKRCYGRNCYRAAVLNRCATVIQSAFRGYRVRRDIGELLQQRLQQRLLKRAREKVELQRRRKDKAAVVIQCAYRIHVARRIVVELRERRERERLLRRNRIYAPFRLDEQVY